MPLFKKSLLMMIVSLVLLGLTTHKRIEADTLDNTRIGTISLLGENLNMKYVGISIFENKEFGILVDDWKIDSYVVETTKKDVLNLPGYDYIDIDYKYSQFNKIYDSSKRTVRSDFKLNKIEKEFKKMSEEHSLDMIILIISSEMKDPITKSLEVKGYGLIQKKSFIGRRTSVYVAARGMVIDINTMKPLSNFRINYDKKIDNSYWKSENESKKKFLRNWIRDAIGDSIHRNIGKGRLTR